ncbi:type II toxin-antitoxin system HicB family antitoxin [Longimicrobium sp.]|uniref:type II toxin-antitoxin system HicB family antitoxin n=1 Tax=Longimicrobium sp. TaxID=2029185 RepID=UPI002E35D454|nr:type II toxin-antitoxin system HicB family antitoxin [Longimicrobium sp.]HEX6040042.1 type II toxin-antitoxin system HicB family antitoxin [Longimicrobium sp.]
MNAVRMIYWEEDGAWLGYLEAFPDCWTQGESLDEFKEHLEELYTDLTSGDLFASTGQSR